LKISRPLNRGGGGGGGGPILNGTAHWS
jgi:hypothetical protein